eukprot:scaffold43124_cov130-Amphora_coffeaeformis.AAC.1
MRRRREGQTSTYYSTSTTTHVETKQESSSEKKGGGVSRVCVLFFPTRPWYPTMTSLVTTITIIVVMTDNTPLLDPADVTGVTQGNENQDEESNTNNNNNNEQQEEDEEEDSTTPVVPRWYKCFVLAVVLAVTAT